MATLIHIAEVAAILAVAYVLGWAVGYLARHVAASRPRRLEASSEIAAAVAAATDPNALAQGPEIDSVATGPRPVLPSQMPPHAETAPASAQVVADLPATAPEPTAPVAVAGEARPAAVEPPRPAVLQPSAAEPPRPPAPTMRPVLPPMDLPPMDLGPFVTSPVPAPVRTEPAARVRKSEPLPELAPLPEPEPSGPFTATPALRPGEAWSGAIRGRAAVTPPVPEPEPVREPEPAAEVFSQPPIEVPVTLELTETIAFVAEPEAVTAEPEVIVVEPVEPESTKSVAPPSAPPPAPTPLYDEDAAMRAIEGGWSRVKTRARPDTPDISDVGAAVAAAQTAVEQVLAQAGIDEPSQRTSKPGGLAGPRGGRKDDLKRIDGVGALDESTLNNLGVYHFDQIAGWNEAQVFWMENHVFARGRIGHEKWQQQARDLAAAVAN